jgi:U3 small nucleolar RNA-associated protein 21
VNTPRIEAIKQGHDYLILILVVKTTMKPLNDEDDEEEESVSSSADEGESDVNDDEPPPKPVSSSDEEEDDDDDASSGDTNNSNNSRRASSHLFAPYRTVGVVSSGRPFFLCPHENSNSHLLCVPIGERFQMVRTDKLQPVLVSQALPSIAAKRGSNSSSSSRSQKSKSAAAKPHVIAHCVSDTSLDVTVVAHGPNPSTAAPYLTLYRRTCPLATQPVPVRRNSSSSGGGSSGMKHWTVISLLHLGHAKQEMSGEKLGRTENAALVCAVLANTRSPDQEDSATESGVVVVDNSDDDDSDDDVDSKEETDPSSSDSHEGCGGQVVLFLASRTTLTMHRRIRLDPSPQGVAATFRPVAAVHPATYLNKILLGGWRTTAEENAGSSTGVGEMLLLNVRSSKVIHKFQCLPPHCRAVTALEQSPAVDTVAVGTDCGLVLLVNLRSDLLLFKLKHPSRVTSLSFRTDAAALGYGIAPLAVGRADGTVTVWDLSPPQEEELGRTVLCEMKRCHPGGVAKLQYMPQEPLLVSVGTKSNAVLMHIFDNPNHSGRVLKQRRGHMSPPALIRYLHEPTGAIQHHDGTDAAACQILSTGGADRSLRIFSTARSVLDKEFSQGRGLEKKAKHLGMDSKVELLLPAVTGLALSDARSRDWGDLVTIHRDHSFAYVWSSKRGAQSGPLLRQPGWNISSMKVPPPPATRATSVALSACGNFALVGTLGGVIYKYNVQSGNPRGSFPRNEDDASAKSKKRLMPGDITRTIKALEKSSQISNRASNLDKKDQRAEHDARTEQRLRSKLALASHSGFAVTGIAVDSVNRTLVSVGADKKLILWNFSTHSPHKKSPYMLPSAATMMRHVRESDLAAIALEDFSVVLFDCSSLSIVRRFGAGMSAHKGPITDLCFSPDGRTLLSSSLDSTVRVYDVPTSLCIEWLGFRSPPTSMTMSPTGEFLATTHQGKLGIHVWSDRSFYQTVQSHGGTMSEPVDMDDPVPVSDDASDRNETIQMLRNSNSGAANDIQTNEKEDFAPKQTGLVTMSGLPPTHWKTLFHLELIKERNKPIEPPKKPPTAPFFLQWRSGEALDGAEPIETESKKPVSDKAENEEEWAAAWSDENADDDEASRESASENEASAKPLVEYKRDRNDQAVVVKKRRKVSYHRSHLASLLAAHDEDQEFSGKQEFRHVTEYVATLGPSAIDVALSSLCSGSHDLDEGLPLLKGACSWLSEACDTRERFEVINAYVHRFLHLHGPLFAELHTMIQASNESDNAAQYHFAALLASVERLRVSQVAASEAFHEKVQHALCLVRHLSRMV